MLSLEGLQTAICEYAFSKTTDRAASLSKFGLVIPNFPYMLSSTRKSSNMIKSKLVCIGFFLSSPFAGTPSARSIEQKKRMADAAFTALQILAIIIAMNRLNLATSCFDRWRHAETSLPRCNADNVIILEIYRTHLILEERPPESQNIQDSGFSIDKRWNRQTGILQDLKHRRTGFLHVMRVTL